jgi:HTH-type transcriptional regulator / antitoxin HipB
MDRWRFGRAIRALRLRLGLRQVDLAARAGLSRGVIGRIERGEIQRIAWADLVAVCEVLGARLELDLRWRGEGLDRLIDERHALAVAATVRLLRAAGWEAEVEVSFSIYGERGSIDVIGRHSETGLLAVVEVKATIGEANRTVMTLDRKSRLAPQIAAERGWPCRGVARFLVVADTSTARDRIRRHGETFRTAFPMDGRGCLAWLRDPSGPPPSGIVFIPVRNVRSTGTAKRKAVHRDSCRANPRSGRARDGRRYREKTASRTSRPARPRNVHRADISLRTGPNRRAMPHSGHFAADRRMPRRGGIATHPPPGDAQSGR